MRRKIFAVILAFAMIFSTMTVSAFADENTYPNFSAEGYLDNTECIHASDAEVKVTILDPKGEPVLSMDMVYDEDEGGYFCEGNIDALAGIIQELKADYEAAMDSEDYVDVLKNNGYTVTVSAEDDDPDHNFNVTGVTNSLVTADFIELIADYFANMVVAGMIEEMADNDEEMDALNQMFGGTLSVDEDGTAYIDRNGQKTEVTFADLMAASEGIMDDDPETKAAYEEYEKMLEGLEANGGQMFISADIECDCIVMASYGIYHEYYNSEGELDGDDYTYVEIADGSTVSVDAIQPNTEYEGKSYKVKGIYIFDWDTDEYIPLEGEFTVDGWEDILIKYAEVEKTPAVPEQNKSDKSPDTGDESNMIPFAVLMLLSAAGMGITLAGRKKLK